MANNETYFVTGFPGFLASRLVRQLAHEDAHFILMTQPAFKTMAQETVADIARESGFNEANFRIVEGDIAEPSLGLSAAELDLAQQETTTIFHLAAIYDLAVDCGIASHINVEGTFNVNQFAQTVKQLRRYNYISTCYVAGKREGVILETELHHDQGFRNHYEETKYLV